MQVLNHLISLWFNSGLGHYVRFQSVILFSFSYTSVILFIYDIAMSSYGEGT